MVQSELQVRTPVQLEQLQRQYLRATFYGSEATITDQSLESDGRKRGRVLKEGVSAGLLAPNSETPHGGMTYQITAEVIAFVPAETPVLFDVWTSFHEKNLHREAYERPWIRVEDLSVPLQCGLLESRDFDWYVVSKAPYEYSCRFAEAPEVTISDGTRSPSFNQYWTGPFATLEDAIARRKTISGSCIAASSPLLRQQVAEYFAERKLQWGFANNLLWGLVELGVVPEDLVFDADGKPKVESQLNEGYSLQFASNPNPPDRRDAVEWESNLAKSIERWKARIAKAEKQLDILRTVQTGISSFGGWDSFMDALEQRLRSVGADEQRDAAEQSASD